MAENTIIADKVTIDLLGKDGLGKTAVEKINECLTKIGNMLMRENMTDTGEIKLKIRLKRVAQGVNIAWEFETTEPKEVRRSLMAFNTNDGLMTQDTRQMNLANVVRLKPDGENTN